MHKTRDFGHLSTWLTRYGSGAVHWTVFADLNFIQRASEALTDLHRLVRDGSDEEILGLVKEARQAMQSDAPNQDDRQDDPVLSPWAAPTD